MSANKLSTAQEYIRSNYIGTGRLRYDLLSQKLQVITPSNSPKGREMGVGEERSRGVGLWQDLDTRWINTMAVECANETGVSVSDKEIRIVLNSHVVPAINPLQDWLLSLDEYTPSSVSFIDWLSSQVHVSNGSRGVEEEGSRENPQERWRVCFRKWFVAMVASWMQDEVVNQQVLVLIGKQGIYKTTWLEHLMPPCLRAYCTKMANVRDLNKDERMRIAEFGLINLDEIDSMSDKELNQLKSIITSSDVNERAAYGYTKERRIRIASFCASGNKREFLTDQTGNRRWLPFEVESIENPFNWDPDVFPYAQIYGEALYLVRHGFNYWFDLEEIQVLEVHQEDNKMPVTEEQLLPVYFSPANPGDAGALFMSASEISAILRNYGSIPNPMPNNKFGALLQSKGYVRRDYKKRHGYVVLQNIDIDNQRKLQAREAIDV